MDDRLGALKISDMSSSVTIGQSNFESNYFRYGAFDLHMEINKTRPIMAANSQQSSRTYDSTLVRSHVLIYGLQIFAALRIVCDQV